MFEAKWIAFAVWVSALSAGYVFHAEGRLIDFVLLMMWNVIVVGAALAVERNGRCE